LAHTYRNSASLEKLETEFKNAHALIVACERKRFQPYKSKREYLEPPSGKRLDS
jgi:hypothetical protein